MEIKEVYFFYIKEEVGVNEIPDGYGSTKYADSVNSWELSENYDSLEECFIDWKNCNLEKSPIMKGMICGCLMVDEESVDDVDDVEPRREKCY